MDLTPLVRRRFVKQAERVDRWASSADEVQYRLLLDLVGMAKNTEIGRRYDYASIRNYNDFSLSDIFFLLNQCL